MCRACIFLIIMITRVPPGLRSSSIALRQNVITNAYTRDSSNIPSKMLEMYGSNSNNGSDKYGLPMSLSRTTTRVKANTPDCYEYGLIHQIQETQVNISGMRSSISTRNSHQQLGPDISRNLYKDDLISNMRTHTSNSNGNFFPSSPFHYGSSMNELRNMNRSPASTSLSGTDSISLQSRLSSSPSLSSVESSSLSSSRSSDYSRSVDGLANGIDRQTFNAYRSQ